MAEIKVVPGEPRREMREVEVPGEPTVEVTLTAAEAACLYELMGHCSGGSHPLSSFHDELATLVGEVFPPFTHFPSVVLTGQAIESDGHGWKFRAPNAEYEKAGIAKWKERNNG